MTETISRQQRRELLKLQAKEMFKSGVTPQPSQPAQSGTDLKDFLDSLKRDIQRAADYIRVVDNHIWMILETLDRKNLLSWKDVNETENLYIEKENKKKETIKELLAQDLTVAEALDAIKEDSSLPGYKKLNINPIKDLNLNPFEVAVILKEQNFDLTDEELVKLGANWGLNNQHFGFKKE